MKSITVIIHYEELQFLIDFDKMQIIFKAITGSSSHIPWWEGKCGTVQAREKSVAKTTELVATLGSSLC